MVKIIIKRIDYYDYLKFKINEIYNIIYTFELI